MNNNNIWIFLIIIFFAWKLEKDFKSINDKISDLEDNYIKLRDKNNYIHSEIMKESGWENDEINNLLFNNED